MGIRADLARASHLARRFAGSLSPAAPPVRDELWAESWMMPTELVLWRKMPNHDRRHSIAVARRFNASVCDRELMAGALLHDVGKIDSALSVPGRVIATLIGARTDRFSRYLDHERIGAEMVSEAGSAAATIELVSGRGRYATLLRDCDDAR